MRNCRNIGVLGRNNYGRTVARAFFEYGLAMQGMLSGGYGDTEADNRGDKPRALIDGSLSAKELAHAHHRTIKNAPLEFFRLRPSVFFASVIWMDVLERLFDSPVRAKLLKLFLMNPDVQFSAGDASKQLQVRPIQFAAEARRLKELGLIRASSVWTLPPLGKAKERGKRKAETKRVKVFAANKGYPLFDELRALCLKSAPHAKGPLAAKIRRLGTIKLAVLAGIFIDSPTSRVDLLIVGDGFRKSRTKSLVEWLESKIGKELHYVAMSTSEFKYRMDMYDRFVRDILESPHETIINKLGV